MSPLQIAVHFQAAKRLQRLLRLLFTAAFCVSATNAFSQEGFESKIADLIRATDQAKKRITASPEQQVPKNDSLSQTAEQNSAENAMTKTAGEASEIRKRLQLLRRLRLSAPQKTPTTPNATSPSPPSVDEALSPVASGPNLSEVNAPPGLETVESNIDSQMTDAPSITDNPPMIQSQQILDSAVDLLQLGESLYRTQNYTAAIRSFESIDETKLSLSDQSWLELMTALSRRALGDKDEAQATLRDLANSDGADYTVPLAKWWLAHSEATDAVKTKLQEVENQLSPLKQRIDAHVQP